MESDKMWEEFVGNPQIDILTYKHYHRIEEFLKHDLEDRSDIEKQIILEQTRKVCNKLLDKLISDVLKES